MAYIFDTDTQLMLHSWRPLVNFYRWVDSPVVGAVKINEQKFATVGSGWLHVWSSERETLGRLLFQYDIRREALSFQILPNGFLLIGSYSQVVLKNFFYLPPCCRPVFYTTKSHEYRNLAM